MSPASLIVRRLRVCSRPFYPHLPLGRQLHLPSCSSFRHSRKIHIRSSAQVGATEEAHSTRSHVAAYLDRGMTVMDEEARKQYYVPLTTKTPALECSKAFELLSDKEKAYVYHWSQASWLGGLITVLQTAPESPAVFILLQNLFRHSKLKELEKLAKEKASFSDDDWLALKFYASGVYHNMGNYVGFGDTKLVPQVDKKKLHQLVIASGASTKNEKLMEEVWGLCGDRMYDLENSRFRQLGLKPDGVTTYFSSNCDKNDAEVVKQFLVEHEIEPYNSRVFKTTEGDKKRYEIRHASASNSGSVEAGKTRMNESAIEYNSNLFVLTNGDYAPFMAEMVTHMKEAARFSANDTEKKMLDCYAESFETGSLEAHKKGSLHWVHNKKPVVEGYIGFIETYRDPSGQRGEFEGFVAVVDKAKSARLNKLVDTAETIISQLPWPKEYEKDRYLRPDYSELTVVSFASSGVPIGINIPNYDTIRQNEGFKNVSLGNVISAALKSRPPQFMSLEDHELLTKHETVVLEVQVAIHELLGHGSGKLFQKQKDGKFNFDYENVKDFESGDVCSYYEVGESYDSVFGPLASTYEECRAETVAVYLSLLPEVLNVWNIPEKDHADVIFCVWLAMAVSGLKSLPYYIMEQEKWGQAHAQGRFAILRVMEEAEILKVSQVTGQDGKPDLLLSLDRNQIATKGKEAIGTFLGRLQLYKSTANKEQAYEMMTEYSAVCNMPPKSEEMIAWHKVAVARKIARNLLVQPNLVLDKGDKVTLKTYPATTDGMISSFQDRYEKVQHLEEALLKCALQDAPHFSM